MLPESVSSATAAPEPDKAARKAAGR